MIKSKNDIGIIFLSGAGLQTWIWDKVADKIAAPSMAISFSDLGKENTLHDYVDAALVQRNQLDATKVIVVAHSISGVVGTELAKRLGDRLAGFITVSAVIPKPGKSYLSVFPPFQQLAMRLAFKLAGTKPPASAIRKSLCNDINEELADKIVHDFKPESTRLYTDSTSADGLPNCRALYITTLTDKALPIALQEKIVQYLPNAKSISIASGHLPMLSHPNELADYINEFTQSI